jgi:putative oxidoreductase
MTESMYLKSTKALFMNHKNQHIISRIAIWLLAIVMIIFGIQHFKYPKEMMNFVPTFLPGGEIWVYFVGAAFILAAISFISNRYVSLAGYLLAGMLFLFVILVHWPNFSQAGDVEMKRLAFSNLLKDTAIAAFALYIGSNSRHQKMNIAD